jgi:hypothetical protein
MTEDKIQSLIVAYWNEHYRHCSVLVHVPNQRHAEPQYHQKLAAMGVIRGFPDLVLFWGTSYYFIEVKTPDGRHSDYQKDFAKRVEKVLAKEVVTVRSVENFVLLITEINRLSTK